MADCCTCTDTLQYDTPFPDGLQVGTAMKIRGYFPSGTDRSDINLACSTRTDGDIALHFNPRFDQNKVVLNSRVNGVWGTEEFGPHYPFQYGQLFEVMIITTKDGFKVLVGNQSYHFFCHQMPLQRVHYLLVGRNIILESVNIC
ncbi:galectin-7-like [Erinaceus europaeus]|uniref:Galectin n=1 Tax=Erinaceus europaeus TaxID=9365 RepID=A0ABM3X0W6_ERIEU|nr:galectin-7-like [Erinaceus europaeus]